jgi:hypothetical protein
LVVLLFRVGEVALVIVIPEAPVSLVCALKVTVELLAHMVWQGVYASELDELSLSKSTVFSLSKSSVFSLLTVKCKVRK